MLTSLALKSKPYWVAKQILLFDSLANVVFVYVLIGNLISLASLIGRFVLSFSIKI